MNQDTQSTDGPARELPSEQFQDYEGPYLPEGAGFDLSQLLTGDSLRGMAAIVVSVLVLRTPSTSPGTFAFLLAVILIAWAVGGLAELRHAESRTGWDLARVIFLVAAAAGLVLVPDFTGESLGRAGGFALIALGLVNGYRAFRGRETGTLLEPLLGAVFYLVIGVALVSSPRSILGLAVLSLRASTGSWQGCSLSSRIFDSMIGRSNQVESGKPSWHGYKPGQTRPTIAISSMPSSSTREMQGRGDCRGSSLSWDSPLR